MQETGPDGISCASGLNVHLLQEDMLYLLHKRVNLITQALSAETGSIYITSMCFTD